MPAGESKAGWSRKEKKILPGIFCTSECHCVCILNQPRVNPETLGRVYHLLRDFSLLRDACEKRAITCKSCFAASAPALVWKVTNPTGWNEKEEYKKRFVRRIHERIASLSSPWRAFIRYASVSSPPLVCR